MSAGFDVLATDGLKVLGTLGFFVPAAILVTLVVVAVVRDRRQVAREEAEEAAEQARARESLGDYEDIQARPPADGDRPTPPPGR
jgi:heme exporter protein D